MGKEFFNKKRGDYLFVSYQNNEILGFILIIKKKKILSIDLIATSKKYRKKGVATSLINYTNNKLMKKVTGSLQEPNLIIFQQ